MKKIPTVFQRDESRRYVTDEVTPGCEWVLAGEGEATRKYDGTCVLIRRDGMATNVYVRREVKPGKQPPENFVPVETDDVTGKTVGWEPAAQSGFAKFIDEALQVGAEPWLPGTYELVGPRINGNPERGYRHELVPHTGAQPLPFVTPPDRAPHTFETIRESFWHALPEHWEGIVWHHPDGRMAKLKRRDFPSAAQEPGT